MLSALSTVSTARTTPAQKPRGAATISFFTTWAYESEPTRIRHRPDRTMRVGDEVAMFAEWRLSVKCPAHQAHPL